MGDDALARLGFDPAQAKADPSFNTLRRLGMTASQIEELNLLVCGTQTVEGAPHLKDEHLAVFDCANNCGKLGKRFIEAGGHIRMMAAAQPFISGAISKTINLPHDATLEDIKESYRASWELGLKANALYRDGCKLSQPLNIKSDADIEEENGEDDADALALAEVEDDMGELVGAVAGGNVRIVIKKEIEIVHRPMRRRLPETRRSITHKFNIAGHEGYLTVGIYEDGAPGELFITMAKEGSTIGGLMDSLGTATSVALQYGVPLESLVRKFTHQRFEPAGMTANRDIPFAKSLVDYIFRWLGMEFIPGYREANAPKRATEETVDSSDMLAGERRIATGNARRIIAESESEMRPSSERAASERAATVRERSSKPLTGDQTMVVQRIQSSTQSSTLSMALESAGDAPPCDVCGTITVRSGTCYKCLNCGNSMGCS
jgi:ribonucleoside-diphosphate reductase alpha chain